jgi:hypothetical protein
MLRPVNYIVITVMYTLATATNLNQHSQQPRNHREEQPITAENSIILELYYIGTLLSWNSITLELYYLGTHEQRSETIL